MPNIKQTIDGHNKTKQSQTATMSEESTCNCRKKEECPMSKKCSVESIVYQATVSTNDNSPPQTYVGLSENSFKTIDITTTKRHLLCTRKGTPLNLVNISGS
jgi:hypothetical protein